MSFTDLIFWITVVAILDGIVFLIYVYVVFENDWDLPE